MKVAYLNTVEKFISDVENNTWMNKLEDGFKKEFGGWNPKEHMSWPGSHPHLANALRSTGIGDAIIALEVQLPTIGGFRADAVLFGKGKNGSSYCFVIELKQWSEAKKSKIGYPKIWNGYYPDDHPSIQAYNFQQNLEHWLVEANPSEGNSVTIRSCAFLFNLRRSDAGELIGNDFENDLKNSPLYTGDDISSFRDRAKSLLSNESGLEVYTRMSNSAVKPSINLKEKLKDILLKHERFLLAGEQLNAAHTINACIDDATLQGGKHVIVIDGGPGSGKTGVAMNVMSSALEKNIIPDFIAPSAAVIHGYRKIVKELKSRFKFTFEYSPKDKKKGDWWNNLAKHENQHDLLIIDEAHRLPQNTEIVRGATMPHKYRSKISTCREIIRASKVSVFFVDDLQIIKPQESVRMADIIRDANAENATVHEFALPYQFRAGGSSRYLDWLNRVLQVDGGEPFSLTHEDQINFSIVNDPNEFSEILSLENVDQDRARIIAGWCWYWSQTFDENNELLNEVAIQNHNSITFSMPWEAPLSKKGMISGIPPGEYWAIDPRAQNQIGSVYTVQGYDFETICEIWPLDLQWNESENKWCCFPGRTPHSGKLKNGPAQYDNIDHFLRGVTGDELVVYLKNIYRILLTRGMYNVHVYFMHEETKSRFSKFL